MKFRQDVEVRIKATAVPVQPSASAWRHLEAAHVFWMYSLYDPRPQSAVLSQPCSQTRVT